MLAQSPMTPPSPQGPPSPASAPRSPSKTRNVGSRRIFPAMFKLQVLDAYRYDPECKGNQRATARKFNVHRRQIQKWLQCEDGLRSSVLDAQRYDAGLPVGPHAVTAPGPEARLNPRLMEPMSRVYKHDALTLKLVAQKLYPSSFNGLMLKDSAKGDMTNTAVAVPMPIQQQQQHPPPVPGFVPKEYQLNDTHRVPLHADYYKLNRGPTAGRLILKSVGGQSGSQTISRPATPQFPHAAAPAPAPARPQPVFTGVAHPHHYPEEPYNLVVVPSRGGHVPSPPAATTATAAASPLPARVAEIVADSKTSAFSPKRKWLNESMQEEPQTEALPLLTNRCSPKPVEEPKPKKPCPDFSIERLCGASTTKEDEVKTEVVTPPPPAPPMAARFPAPLPFLPPLVMPHRTIPELKSLHFRPEPPCQDIKKEADDGIAIKQESLSDDEDDEIDVLTTSPSPLSVNTFEFPLGFPACKRRSFSHQFKLDVLDAFYNDEQCHQNQRATARKFNINRRQVQKWLSMEEDLRCEGGLGGVPCARCPHHCVSMSAPVSPSCDDKCLRGFGPIPAGFPPFSWMLPLPAIY